MSTTTKSTKNSKTAHTSTKDERPHRRLSLTRPTLPRENPAEEKSAASPMLAGRTPALKSPLTKPNLKKKRESKETPGGENELAAPVVRVMAYLSAPEATLLDELWMQYRRSPQKPSKSDILRAALMLASSREDELTVMLSQQHTNTLSRQRISKVKNTDGEA